MHSNEDGRGALARYTPRAPLLREGRKQTPDPHSNCQRSGDSSSSPALSPSPTTHSESSWPMYPCLARVPWYCHYHGLCLPRPVRFVRIGTDLTHGHILTQNLIHFCWMNNFFWSPCPFKAISLSSRYFGCLPALLVQGFTHMILKVVERRWPPPPALTWLTSLPLEGLRKFIHLSSRLG